MSVIIPLNEQGMPRKVSQPFPTWLAVAHVLLLASATIAYLVVS